MFFFGRLSRDQASYHMPDLRHNPYVGSFAHGAARRPQPVQEDPLLLGKSNPLIGTFRHSPPVVGLNGLLWEDDKAPHFTRMHLARKQQHLSIAELASLPRSTFTRGLIPPGGSSQSSQGEDDFPQCAICLDAYQDGDELRTLSCGHLFHQACVDRWLLGDLKSDRCTSNCPTCRKHAISEPPTERQDDSKSMQSSTSHGSGSESKGSGGQEYEAKLAEEEEEEEEKEEDAIVQGGVAFREVAGEKHRGEGEVLADETRAVLEEYEEEEEEEEVADNKEEEEEEGVEEDFPADAFLNIALVLDAGCRSASTTPKADTAAAAAAAAQPSSSTMLSPPRVSRLSSSSSSSLLVSPSRVAPPKSSPFRLHSLSLAQFSAPSNVSLAYRAMLASPCPSSSSSLPSPLSLPLSLPSPQRTERTERSERTPSLDTNDDDCPPFAHIAEEEEEEEANDLEVEDFDFDDIDDVVDAVDGVDIASVVNDDANVGDGDGDGDGDGCGGSVLIVGSDDEDNDDLDDIVLDQPTDAWMPSSLTSTPLTDSDCKAKQKISTQHGGRADGNSAEMHSHDRLDDLVSSLADDQDLEGCDGEAAAWSEGSSIREVELEVVGGVAGSHLMIDVPSVSNTTSDVIMGMPLSSSSSVSMCSGSSSSSTADFSFASHVFSPSSLDSLDVISPPPSLLSAPFTNMSTTSSNLSVPPPSRRPSRARATSTASATTAAAAAVAAASRRSSESNDDSSDDWCFAEAGLEY